MSLTETTENRLWAAINTRAGRRQIDDACDAALYHLVRAGVARMEDEHRLDDTGCIALAEQNLIRFVDALLAHRPDEMVRIASFERACSQLCPLWPFCDSDGNDTRTEESPWA